jgi:hypothetical protein
LKCSIKNRTLKSATQRTMIVAMQLDSKNYKDKVLFQFKNVFSGQ